VKYALGAAEESTDAPASATGRSSNWRGYRVRATFPIHSQTGDYDGRPGFVDTIFVAGRKLLSQLVDEVKTDELLSLNETTFFVIAMKTKA
jgi:hypothetical protein